MKLTELQKFKHDTIGKFQTLKSLIELLDEENLSSNESYEILMATHESFQNMLESSHLFLNKYKKEQLHD